MSNFYTITIKAESDPNWKNKSISEKIKVNLQQLYGIVAVATAIFDNNRDDYFSIYDDQGKLVDLNQLLNQSNAIVFEGEPAFELEPEYDQYYKEISWMDIIATITKNMSLDKYVTKSYTVKAAGYDGNYLFQYDDDNFLNGMKMLITKLGLEINDILVYLHLANFPINVS